MKALATAFALGALVLASSQARTPQAVADELLAADRALSEASRGRDVVNAILAMMADDGTLMAPGLPRGREAIAEALRANPDNLDSSLAWTPVRAGVSADGLHGFTFGTMKVAKKDGTTSNAKYLSYWVKGAQGWRVAAYKRQRGPETLDPVAMMAPSLPAALTTAASDAAAIEKARHEVDAAERAFSDEAQKIGVGPAFAKWGSADAINLGGPEVNGFLVSAEKIGEAIGQGMPPGPTPFHWHPDRVIVASSGDLGVTIGYIRLHPGAPKPRPGVPDSSPFFTIWKKGPHGWRYVAE